MKKLVLLLTLTISTSFSFAQTAMSKEEYQKLDSQERRISDYVNSALAALNGLKLNGTANYANYQATISVSSNEKDKLGNMIGIGISEGNLPMENAQSCTICSIGSGITCYKRIRTVLQNGGTVIITVVLNSEGCGVLSW